ncbi:hypothetical protein Agub_g6689, partial [Astrephomene gubernaculifera]
MENVQNALVQLRRLGCAKGEADAFGKELLAAKQLLDIAIASPEDADWLLALLISNCDTSIIHTITKSTENQGNADFNSHAKILRFLEACLRKNGEWKRKLGLLNCGQQPQQPQQSQQPAADGQHERVQGTAPATTSFSGNDLTQTSSEFPSSLAVKFVDDVHTYMDRVT